jgi:hypothetical protein
MKHLICLFTVLAVVSCTGIYHDLSDSESVPSDKEPITSSDEIIAEKIGLPLERVKSLHEQS